MAFYSLHHFCFKSPPPRVLKTECPRNEIFTGRMSVLPPDHQRRVT